MIDYRTKKIDGELYYFVAIFEKQYVKFSSNNNDRTLTIGWLGDELSELGERLKKPDIQANDEFPFKLRSGHVHHLYIIPNMEQKYGLKFLDLVEVTRKDDIYYGIRKAITLGESSSPEVLQIPDLWFWIQGECGASYFIRFPKNEGLNFNIRKLEQQIPFNEFGLKKFGSGIPSLVYKAQIVIKDTLKKNEKIIWNLSCFPYDTNFMYEGSVSDMIREKLIEQTRSFNAQSTLANLVSLPKDQQLYLFGSDYQNLCKLFSLPPNDPFMVQLIANFEKY